MIDKAALMCMIYSLGDVSGAHTCIYIYIYNNDK